MADIPVPRSYPQILGDMIDAFLSKQGVKNLRVGGPILSILETAAQGNLRSSQDIFDLLAAISLDSATGLALARIGADERVPKITEAPSTGFVDISDTSFEKIGTKIFQGKPAPIVGSVSVDVVDASLFPDPNFNVVKVYIGRGTGNYEGPLTVASIVNNGTFWSLGLASATVKFHNSGDEVVLAQGGNRVIPAGSIVKTPQANLSDAVEFKTLYGVTIPDGETDATGVLVICQKPGVIGNVPANAIKEFSSEPFTGATVNNPLPYSNGVETENDDDYRERIKNVRQSRTQGTSLAITTAVTGITAPDENKRVSSASVVARSNYPTTLYIDDGTGYEERSKGVSIEALVDSATGGEQFFQTTRRPISKAFLVSRNAAPFALSNGAKLTVRVGGQLHVHAFDPLNFASIANASAFEVIASINANQTLGFVARSADAGQKVVLFAKDDTNEEIKIEIPEDAANANEAFRFPSSTVYSLLVYKNDRLLNKDGRTAKLQSRHFDEWNTVAGPQTLRVAVDGTPAQTYTFVDQDFVNAATGFVAVGKNSTASWAAVINAKVPGVTATVEGARVILSSNAGAVSKSTVEVLGGTLVTERFFPAEAVSGVGRDYTVDRNYGQIRLERVLDDGDRLSIGTANTRSFVESAVIPTTNLANDIKGWFVVDGNARVIEHGVGTSTALDISVWRVHDWGQEVAIDAPIDAFTNVQDGDWILFWDPQVPASMHGAHRVSTAAPNKLIVERRLAVTARAAHKSVTMAPVGANISRVFTSGGYSLARANGSYQAPGTNDGCEIYDPNTQTVTKAASMGWRRAFHTATTLNDGRVLVTGGVYDNAAATVTDGHTWLDTTEIYDPTTDTWTPGPSLADAKSHHRAIKLADGRVMICGGLSRDLVTGALVYSGKIDIFNPVGDTITNVGPTMVARARHGLALLGSGDVLIVSGETTGSVVTTNVQQFNPGGLTVGAAPSVTVGRRDFGIANLTGDDVVIAGGDAADAEAATFETYIAGVWGGDTDIDSGTAKFSFQDLVKLQNGTVVMLGAYDSSNADAPLAYEFDGVSVWSSLATSPLNVDHTYYDGRQYALLYNAAANYLNHVVAIGGRNTWSTLPTAHIEQFNYGSVAPVAYAGPTWSYPESGAATGIQLGLKGLAVVRSERILQEVTVPTGTNYTASSLIGQFNGQLRGATASVYRTNRYRIRTNSFGLTGDIALVAQDLDAEAALKLEVSDAIENLTGHYGSVESSNSEFGTTSFNDTWIFGQSEEQEAAISDALVVNGDDVLGGAGIVALRNEWTGLGPDLFHKRYGGNVAFLGHIHSLTQYSATALVNTREAAIRPWTPHDRMYLASPFAVGPNDDLTVIVNNDPNKSFPVKMWRKLKPGTTSYGVSNVFKDGEAANASLATTFGLNYSFDDFAAFMKARAVAYSSTAPLKMLLRYYRFGSDGDGVRVRFANPLAADSSLSVAIAQDGLAAPQVKILLPSSAEKTIPVNTGTRIGCAIASGSRNAAGHGQFVYLLGFDIAQASRSVNATTAWLTLPSGITSTGLVTGNRVYINSTDPNFSSGRYKLINVFPPSGGQQRIVYTEVAADQAVTLSIGTATNDDSGELLFSGNGLLANDFFRISANASAVPASFRGETFVISAVANQYLRVASGDEEILFGADDGVVTWGTLTDPTFITAFGNPQNTATQIVTDLNTAAGEENSGWPLTATILGTGAGILAEPTSDTMSDPNAWFTLVDGLNWISVTDSPLTIAGDYTLTFKKAVDGSLATGSDWINEEVRIAPITAAGIVRWLNTPTVSGLFTAATIEASDAGTKVQITTRTPGGSAGIQVQGGLANGLTAAIVGSSSSLTGVSTIKKTDSTGLSGGMWCRITNQITQPKQQIINGSTTVVSWANDGLIQLGTPVYFETIPEVQARLVWEKQGNFVAIRDVSVLNPASPVQSSGAFSFFSTVDGDFVKIDAVADPYPTDPAFPAPPVDNFSNVPVQNQGIFRIVKVDKAPIVLNNAGTIWIENPDAVEGVFDSKLRGFSSGSMMPGDKLVISTDFWGEKNRGVWLIEKVGVTSGFSTDQFQTDTTFKVSTVGRAPQPIPAQPALNDEADKIQVIEAAPLTLFKRIENICVNPIDPTFTDLRWDTPELVDFVNAGVGSVISPIDKLAFPTDLSSGVDGYSYGVGLIGESNRVIYGDPSDTATYPGVAAAGGVINIQGPLVRRIQIALNLRIRSGGTAGGGTAADIADRVRSAVATIINQTPLGKSVAISTIVAAASKVPGVIAVSVLSPLYAVGRDLIAVQPFEKPLVLNLEQDIGISFSGE